MNTTVRNDVEVKSVTAWRVNGLLFENCNCQLVCPGHMSFRQLCTHERCIGAWAILAGYGLWMLVRSVL